MSSYGGVEAFDELALDGWYGGQFELCYWLISYATTTIICTLSFQW
jgi:hypothetical protein